MENKGRFNSCHAFLLINLKQSVMTKTIKAILMIALAILIACAAHSQTIHCKGTTKAGKECRNKPETGKEYCRLHDPGTPRCGFIKKDGQPCKMVVKAIGEHCRYHTK